MRSQLARLVSRQIKDRQKQQKKEEVVPIFILAARWCTACRPEARGSEAIRFGIGNCNHHVGSLHVTHTISFRWYSFLGSKFLQVRRKLLLEDE
nr:hypothetical protein Iba_scaffold24386.2CG0570 [Ipomoea batatas]